MYIFLGTKVANSTCVIKVPLKSHMTKYQKWNFNVREYITGKFVSPNKVTGLDHMRDPRLNKGLAFTLEERQALGLHGLLAANFKTQEEQVEICKVSVERYKNNLNKYLYLVELQDSNERLFYSLLSTDIAKYMPIVYTPTVGLACQKFGLVYRRTRGLFITIHDAGNIYSVLKNWPENTVKAVVFTDGERILGLGDLGSYGMGIPVGKLSLYTALAGIKPYQCLPIMLDVGTDNKTLLEDPLYIGLRQERVRGEKYDAFIDEFMSACVRKFGRNVLLQFEDFALRNAGRFLEKYRYEYCTFNDDIQGTASAAVAGLLAAERVTRKELAEHVVLFLGAGSAATGIAALLVASMVEKGITEEAAIAKIFMFDAEGLVTNTRSGGVPDQAKKFAKNLEPEKNFEVCVTKYKPTILIGVSTVGGAFTPEILKQMAQNAARPIIFALSNPTSKAECTAQAAYDNTEGRCIYASGSPFPKVKYGGKEYETGQGNNAYIFPGVSLGVIASGSLYIPEAMFLIAAKICANMVKESDLALGRIYPDLKQIREISFNIATDVAKYAYDEDIASVHPKPKNLKDSINKQIYRLTYDSYMPTFYKYPPMPKIKVKSMKEFYSDQLLRVDMDTSQDNLLNSLYELQGFITSLQIER